MGMPHGLIPPPPDEWVARRVQSSAAPLRNCSLARGYTDAVLFVALIGALAAAVLHAMGVL